MLGSDSSPARVLGLPFLPGTPGLCSPRPGTLLGSSLRSGETGILRSEQGPGDGRPGLTLVTLARQGRAGTWDGEGRLPHVGGGAGQERGEERGSFGSERASELRENSTHRPKGEPEASLLNRGCRSPECGLLSEAPSERA